MDMRARKRVAPEQRAIVAELAASNRVRELANFLELDAESVAEGLVKAAQRDLAPGRYTPRPHPGS
jgi:hypothetical protein